MKKLLAGVLAAAAVCSLLLGVIHTQQMQQDIAGKVIRFHVRANSDSVSDQQLKLKVRDAVGSFLAEKLKDAKTQAQSRQLICENLDHICAVADETIREAGYSYPVSAALDDCEFPEKQYGILTFPAGTYEALHMEIGTGAGHNWWCVLYPNLCFSGSLYRTDDQANSEKLEQVLSPEECQAVMESENYRVRFRLLELFQNLRTAENEDK